MVETGEWTPNCLCNSSIHTVYCLRLKEILICLTSEKTCAFKSIIPAVRPWIHQPIKIYAYNSGDSEKNSFSTVTINLLPPAYGVRGKVIFILGNVCLFTLGTGYAWTGYAAGGAPLVVSRRRTFLFEVSYTLITHHLRIYPPKKP